MLIGHLNPFSRRKQGSSFLVFPNKLYGFLILIITICTKQQELLQREKQKTLRKEARQQKFIIHTNSSSKVGLWQSMGLSFVVLVITHFFLTPLLSCPLLGFLRDVSSFSKPQTVNCVRNAPLLTISCSARKLMQYSIVVRRRRLGKIHFTACHLSRA